MAAERERGLGVGQEVGGDPGGSPVSKAAPEIDTMLREWAYQKALGYKEQKLNRMREYVRRLEAALTKQKSQTADDQRYIDMLEAELSETTVAHVRAEIAEIRAAKIPPALVIEGGSGV